MREVETDDVPVVDAELVDEAGSDPPTRSPVNPEDVMTGRELEVRQGRGVLFQTDDPIEIIKQASAVADQFKDLLRRQKMVKNIQGREHVLLEGWQTVGMMLGVTAVIEWSRPYCDPVTGEPVISDYHVHEVIKRKNGDQVVRDYDVKGMSWESRVVAQRADGTIIAAGEAMCSRNESTWSTREDFALRSMAQTRASGKALRAVLSWIVTMAGYSPTPGEEVASEPEGSTQAASAELDEVFTAAMKYLLVDEHRVAWVRAQIEGMAGGFLPAPAAQGAVLAVKAYRDKKQAESERTADDSDDSRPDGGTAGE